METVGGVRIYLAPKQYDDISSPFFFFFFCLFFFLFLGGRRGKKLASGQVFLAV